MGLDDVTKYLSEVSVRRSPWNFVSSAGVELSVGTPIAHVGLNGTTGAIWVKHGAKGSTVRLSYAGVGGSAGLALIPFPANLSFSIPAMPSSGTSTNCPLRERP